VHVAPRNDTERREQRKAARLALDSSFSFKQHSKSVPNLHGLGADAAAEKASPGHPGSGGEGISGSGGRLDVRFLHQTMPSLQRIARVAHLRCSLSCCFGLIHFHTQVQLAAFPEQTATRLATWQTPGGWRRRCCRPPWMSL